MEQSFCIEGPKLFNSLPKYLRDLKGVSLDKFKKGLDSFLSQIPDEPQITMPKCFLRPSSKQTFTR